MKIRTKLLLLAICSQLMMVLALGIYLVILAPIDDLQKENAFFQTASRKTRALEVELNKLGTGKIDTQLKAFNVAMDEYIAAVDAVGTLTKLPALNDTMSQAVTAIGALRDLSLDSIGMVEKGMVDLQADVVKLQALDSDIDLASILMRSAGNDVQSDITASVYYHANRLILNLYNASQALAMTANVIEEKDSVVAGEIAKIKTQSTLIAVSVIVVVIFIVLSISILVATTIAHSIHDLSKNVGIMSTGDLTRRFSLDSKDEVGSLGKDLDSLLDNLNSSLRQIQAASNQNRGMREDLVRIVGESSSSAAQIEANSESIRNQMVRMDGMIENAVGEIGVIVTAIRGFHERLGIQNHHVSETVSAVTEMLASIENIDRITERDRQAAEFLVAESEQSKEVFDNAFEKVAEIAESISAIQEMASVIAGIASQTNVLAMNAAIEAAHAGEFGKGFAVVAAEIGKLANASALSSVEIAHTIDNIVVKMNEAGSTREATTKAITNISNQIHKVSDSIGEIYSNVNEMQLGSKQILGSMESLRSTSGQITGESAEIEKTTKAIGVTMGDLGRISHEVTSNIGEIAIGIQMISRSVRNVSSHTEQIAIIGDKLDSSVAIFTTRDETDSPDGFDAVHAAG